MGILFDYINDKYNNYIVEMLILVCVNKILNYDDKLDILEKYILID